MVPLDIPAHTDGTCEVSAKAAADITNRKQVTVLATLDHEVHPTALLLACMDVWPAASSDAEFLKTTRIIRGAQHSRSRHHKQTRADITVAATVT
jgi:hypothetical protein